MADGPGPGTIKATALIVAAGSGQRLGAGGPKALVRIAGHPMYEWSVAACRDATSIDRTVVAVPPGMGEEFTVPGIDLVEGGAARSHSVEAGLALVDTEYVVVQDAARPMVTPELIDEAVARLDASPGIDAVIAAALVTDTIKRVDPEGSVTETLDRSQLRAVQTPQVFRTRALREAMKSGDLEKATDDAFLIESAGGRVGVLEAPASNIKVTVPSDIRLAELLLSGSPENSNPSLQDLTT